MLPKKIMLKKKIMIKITQASQSQESDHNSQPFTSNCIFVAAKESRGFEGEETQGKERSMESSFLLDYHLSLLWLVKADLQIVTVYMAI